MGVVAIDAYPCYGQIGVDRPESLSAGALECGGIGLGRVGLHGFEAAPLEFGDRCIGLVDRPLTDEMVLDTDAGQFRHRACLLQELHG